MRQLTTFAGVGVAVMLTACAGKTPAGDAAPVAAAQVTSEEATTATTDGSRRVCKTREKTGTRFGTRVCATADEWAELEQREAEQGREMKGAYDRANQGTPPQGPGG